MDVNKPESKCKYNTSNTLLTVTYRTNETTYVPVHCANGLGGVQQEVRSHGKARLVLKP